MDTYKDIIDRPHHTSPVRKRMPKTNRAAQFAPFAALTGFEASVAEAARLTDQKLTLTDKETEDLNQKLNFLKQHLSDRPQVAVTYFIPDGKKSGGCYVTYIGNLRTIDEMRQLLIFTDKTEIPISEILHL
jgi:hypothetical protein